MGKRQDRGQPRYRQLADVLIGDISRGRLKVGETLPGELELVERFNVSRHTVREALRRLDDLGLIDRQQGVGTVVRARRSSPSYVQTVRSPSELMRYPADSRLVVTGAVQVRANRQLARLLDVRTGSEWLKVSALRRLKSQPVAIAWTDVYLLPEYGDIVPHIGRRGQLVYQLIEAMHGERVDHIRVQIRAGVVTQELAGPLEAPIGMPSLTVIRHYHGRGHRPFEISVSEHPSDRYLYSLDLQRGWQSSDTWTTQ
ncbi:MAG: Mannosyl-D-glycerate transport/metabolism system repressor MngR [Steroidobacteraceae bacterium]|nr:Mannosyl-D-glycerate transport/metabolism system repressor MngR [Steroidobacteraceae bacterium]